MYITTNIDRYKQISYTLTLNTNRNFEWQKFEELITQLLGTGPVSCGTALVRTWQLLVTFISLLSLVLSITSPHISDGQNNNEMASYI